MNDFKIVDVRRRAQTHMKTNMDKPWMMIQFTTNAVLTSLTLNNVLISRSNFESTHCAPSLHLVNTTLTYNLPAEIFSVTDYQHRMDVRDNRFCQNGNVQKRFVRYFDDFAVVKYLDSAVSQRDVTIKNWL